MSDSPIPDRPVLVPPRVDAFTAEEAALLADRTRFAVKARAQAKVRAQLEALERALRQDCRLVSLAAPVGWNRERSQLVKGEHLEDCPYQYLDYPKHFVDGTAFTFRTLVWWGHQVTFAWLFDGVSVPHVTRRLLARYHELAEKGLLIGRAPGLWEWKVGDGFTLPLRAENRTQVAALLDRRSTVKVCRVLPCDDPAFVAGALPELGLAAFRAMLPLVCDESARG